MRLFRNNSLDGSLSKAPLAQEAVGPNPPDREKNGRKRSVLVDGRGIPLSLVVSGAETPDVSLLPETLHTRILRRAQALSPPPPNI